MDSYVTYRGRPVTYDAALLAVWPGLEPGRSYKVGESYLTDEDRHLCSADGLALFGYARATEAQLKTLTLGTEVTHQYDASNLF